LLLDPAEDRAILLEKPLAARQPRRHHAAGKLLETLPEHTLRVVARDDAGVVGHPAERGLDRTLEGALRGRFFFDPVKPSAEIAAAGCGCRQGGSRD